MTALQSWIAGGWEYFSLCFFSLWQQQIRKSIWEKTDIGPLENYYTGKGRRRRRRGKATELVTIGRLPAEDMIFRRSQKSFSVPSVQKEVTIL